MKKIAFRSLLIIVFLTFSVLLFAQDATGSDGKNLFTTFKQGGQLMYVLLALGLGALTIIIERIISFFRLGAWSNKRIITMLEKGANPATLCYREDAEDELRGIYTLYNESLEKGLALLSGIGNLAPIVGFLGTVVGMIDAFAAIAAASTVNAKVVAVGIQVALITTAGGLFVATPTLIGYYLFSHILQARENAAEKKISQIVASYPRLSSELKNDSENDSVFNERVI